MRFSKVLINHYILAGLAIIGTLILIITSGGCSGGSGSGGLIFSEGQDQNSSGSVALFLKDAPVYEYDHLWITINKVSLIPADGDENKDPVVIYQSDEGCQVDLLEFRDKEFLLTVKNNVPEGEYAKIRLSVSSIKPEGGPCENIEVKLPSSKIDCNPREPFSVKAGGTISISLDIDANNSINLHPAGESGCIFRPVVFVHIHHGESCPQILRGDIASLITNDTGIEGFILSLPKARGELEVRLLDTAVIFDENCEPAGPDALTAGMKAMVRGNLDAMGRLQASAVAIGDILIVKGTVLGQVDDEGVFPFRPDNLEEIVNDNHVNVKIFEGKTFVLEGCDTQVSSEKIQENGVIRVFGKLYMDEDGSDEFRAIAVVLTQPDETPE